MSVQRCKYFVFFFIFFAFIGCKKLDIEHPVHIEQVASLPVGRASAISFSYGGFGYVLGGRCSQRSDYCVDFWRYSPVTGLWELLPAPPFGGRTKGVAIVAEGAVYVGLGYNGQNKSSYDMSTTLRDWWRYDGSSWTRLQDMISGNTNAGVTFYQDGYIYILYSMSSSASRNIFRYDISSDSWSELSDNWHRAEAVMAGVGSEVGGRYFFGTGYNDHNKNQWYEVYLDADKWVKRRKMPDNGRYCATSQPLGGSILVIGGRHFGGTLTDDYYYDGVLSYDIDDDRWYLRGELPQGLENMISFSIGDTVYCGLGEDINGVVHSEMYKIYE